jgi:hypothetical protein
MAKPWTPEEEQELLARRRKNESFSVIAPALKRTQRECMVHLDKLGTRARLANYRAKILAARTSSAANGGPPSRTPMANAEAVAAFASAVGIKRCPPGYATGYGGTILDPKPTVAPRRRS